MKKKTSRRGSDALRREYDFSALGAPAVGKYHRRSKGGAVAVLLKPDSERRSARPAAAVKKVGKPRRPARGKR